MIPRVAAELEGLVGSAGVDRCTVMGIGMAVAGRQDTAHQVLRGNPQAEDWELFDLEETLSTATDLPVVVENDSTCAAIGEFWVGRIPASADFATVYMATGFGLGLVTKGDIYRGSSSNVGEIGHMVLDVNGPPCWCGSQGCLEMLAAPARIVERALEQPGLAAELGLQGDRATVREDAERVARAAAAEHEQALPVIEESAFYLSRALVSVTNLLDLDQIILAGPGFAAAGEIYLRRIGRTWSGSASSAPCTRRRSGCPGPATSPRPSAPRRSSCTAGSRRTRPRAAWPSPSTDPRRGPTCQTLGRPGPPQDLTGQPTGGPQAFGCAARKSRNQAPALLHRPLLGVVVDADEAEAAAEAERPLPVVHEAPGEVAAQRQALRRRRRRRRRRAARSSAAGPRPRPGRRRRPGRRTRRRSR